MATGNDGGAFPRSGDAGNGGGGASGRGGGPVDPDGAAAAGSDGGRGLVVGPGAGFAGNDQLSSAGGVAAGASSGGSGLSSGGSSTSGVAGASSGGSGLSSGGSSTSGVAGASSGGTASGGSATAGSAGASGGGSGTASGGSATAGSAGASGSDTASGGSATGGTAGTSSGGTGGADTSSCSLAVFAGHDYAACQADLMYDGAAATCQALGMRLVRIDESDENSWVAAAVSDGWVGASDVQAEGEWRWQDGELFWLGDDQGAPVGNLYNAWASADPSGHPSTANCARFDSTAEVWVDVFCDDLNPFVCETY